MPAPLQDVAPVSVPPLHPAPSPDLRRSANTPPQPTLRREWLLLALSLLVLAGVVLPPLINLGRYQHRIVAAMSGSLGRPVRMRAVTLRLLPTPALVLADVEVGEQPGFGAEPILRAPALTAELRLTSLWRGRLEVSRVELSEASLNLVRDSAGHWDIGSVLLQASHVVNAPTGQRRPGQAPRFPYIEITDSRLNVKQGVEKLPYSLLNANVSIWLSEPNVWEVKLEGQPVRTDLALGLADTGLLRVSGRLHRPAPAGPAALGQLPLALHAEWANAPLGQAGRLLTGGDPGWRGDLQATADVTGELDNLQIATHLVIADLHREDFTPSEPFSVDTTCRGRWQRAAHQVSDLACRWPVGDGQLLLAGTVGTTAEVDSGLALTADRLPASFVLALAGLARSDFTPAFRVEGVLSGALRYSAYAGGQPLYTGGFDAKQVVIVASGLSRPLTLSEARLSAATPSPTGLPTLVLSAAPVDLGGDAPVTLAAQLTGQGFLLHAGGSGSIARLGEIGRATHLLPVALARLAPVGSAEFDVTRSAGWQPGDALPARPGTAPGSSKPQLPAFASATGGPEAGPTMTSGWLRLQNVRYSAPFLAAPVLVPSAEAVFAPGAVDWNIPAASVAGSRMQIAVSHPLDCHQAAGCSMHFRLSAAALDADTLHAAVLGRGSGRLLEQLLGRLESGSTHWPPMTGTLHADRFTLGQLSLRDANATLSVADGQGTIEKLDALALGGILHASGSVTRQGRTPIYDLKVELSHAAAAAAGSLFHENWGPGWITAGSQLKLSGSSASELSESASGAFHVEWTHGALGGASPLAHFAEWSGEGRIGERSLTLTASSLSPAVALPPDHALPLAINGRIGFDRTLALGLAGPASATDPGSSSIPTGAITGTLARPSSAPGLSRSE